MKTLMKEVVDQLNTCLLHMFDAGFEPTLEHASRFTHRWNPAQTVKDLIMNPDVHGPA